MKISIAVIGHRPTKLGGYDSIWPEIGKVFEETLLAFGPENISHIYTGMALGFDQIVAEVAIKFGIPVIACIPCKGHHCKWPPESIRKYKDLLATIQKLGGSVVLVSDSGYDYTVMQKRNEYMCNKADALIALWDGSSGGTANCCRYWRKTKDRAEINIYPMIKLIREKELTLFDENWAVQALENTLKEKTKDCCIASGREQPTSSR